MLTITGDKSNVDYANMPLADIVRGNCMDAYYTLKIHDILKEELEDKGVSKLYNVLIRRAIPAYSEMEYNGFDISRKQLNSVGKAISEELEVLEDNLWSLSKVRKIERNKEDKTLNLNSSKQLAYVVYSEEGYDLAPPNYTEGKEPSTAAGDLKFLLTKIREEITRREK